MKHIKFEKSLEQLEKIVTELEGGELSLEDALQKYEEGIALSKLCNQKLNDAEKKIEVLMKKNDGSFATKPFDEHEEAHENNNKGRKTKKKKEARSEDDLFLP